MKIVAGKLGDIQQLFQKELKCPAVPWRILQVLGLESIL